MIFIPAMWFKSSPARCAVDLRGHSERVCLQFLSLRHYLARTALSRDFDATKPEEFGASSDRPLHPKVLFVAQICSLERIFLYTCVLSGNDTVSGARLKQVHFEASGGIEFEINSLNRLPAQSKPPSLGSNPATPANQSNLWRFPLQDR